MPRYSARLTIDAPVERVFDYLSDLRRHVEWAQHRLEIEPRDEATGVGATFASAGHQLGLATRNSVVVTESTRPARFAFETEGKEGRFRHAFDLTPDGNGTRVTKTFEVVRSTPLMTLATPLFALIGPRNMRKDLQRIKARLEGTVR